MENVEDKLKCWGEQLSGLTNIWKDKYVTRQTKKEAGERSGISSCAVWMWVVDSEKERKEEDWQFFVQAVFKTNARISMDCKKNKQISA